jgi:hypothetical protein
MLVGSRVTWGGAWMDFVPRTGKVAQLVSLDCSVDAPRGDVQAERDKYRDTAVGTQRPRSDSPSSDDFAMARDFASPSRLADLVAATMGLRRRPTTTRRGDVILALVLGGILTLPDEKWRRAHSGLVCLRMPPLRIRPDPLTPLTCCLMFGVQPQWGTFATCRSHGRRCSGQTTAEWPRAVLRLTVPPPYSTAW